jgi:hypothetical protein
MALLSLGCVACGGSVSTSYELGGAGGMAGLDAGLTTGGTGGTGLIPNGGPDAGLDGSTFVDPGCPDAAPIVPYYECDPLAAVSGCPSGLGCYPFLDYPVGDAGCGQAQYGAVCQTPGTGQQGDTCGDGGQICAPGYLCVVGSKPGARCMKICPLDRAPGCPSGLVCGETDVEGIGVCV